MLCMTRKSSKACQYGTRARNPCYLTNIFIIIGQFSRADWLRAVIDKCKSDGNDEMMRQFIFSSSRARFFSINFNGNGPQWKVSMLLWKKKWQTWSVVYKRIDNIEMTPKCSKFAVKPLACSSWLHTCPVLVRLFPRPSRSIHFGDVSEENARETALLLRLDHVTRKHWPRGILMRPRD